MVTDNDNYNLCFFLHLFANLSLLSLCCFGLDLPLGSIIRSSKSDISMVFFQFIFSYFIFHDHCYANLGATDIGTLISTTNILYLCSNNNLNLQRQTSTCKSRLREWYYFVFPPLPLCIPFRARSSVPRWTKRSTMWPFFMT